MCIKRKACLKLWDWGGGPLMVRVRERSGCSPVPPGMSVAQVLKEDVSSLY